SGCLMSAAALGALGLAALAGPGWPLGINVFVLAAMLAIKATGGAAIGAGQQNRDGEVYA
ncbi:MAG: MFS transporter, partial [Alphaproteobacteria bacterium HGW-Alphaproteobacteria-15]